MASSFPQNASRFLSDELQLTAEEVGQRKAWLEFGAADEERLVALKPLAEDYADAVIEDLYRHFLAFESTRAFFRDPTVLAYVKQMQRTYFLRLTEGSYDANYIEERLTIGAVHERIGLGVKWYLGAYSFYLRAVATRIFAAFTNDPDRALAAFFSLQKLVFLDIGLAIDTYIARREQTIREQQEAIRELSTPVLQLREGLLILPIIGVLEPVRARQLTEQLLRTIRDTRARVVVMDVTGVPTVDSAVANHLIQTVDAARLMGATVIISGLSPEIAQTLVRIGADLSGLHTVGDLQSGVDAADRIIGYRVIRTGDEASAAPTIQG